MSGESTNWLPPPRNSTCRLPLHQAVIGRGTRAAARPAASPVTTMAGDAADVADAVRGTVVACASRAAAAQAVALSGVVESQLELAGQLDALETEMVRVAAVVDSLAMDPAAAGHMAAARDSLARSRTRLVTVRGRLGRLRGFEQRERLVGVARTAGKEVEMDEVGLVGGVTSQGSLLTAVDDERQDAAGTGRGDGGDDAGSEGDAKRVAVRM